jgi:signal transduction histidine kinase
MLAPLWATLFGWQRLLVAAGAAALAFLVLSQGWKSELWVLGLRIASGAVAALLAFGLVERWPARLPHWLARWPLQLLAVALVLPLVNLAWYIGSTPEGAPPFWEVQDRLIGFWALTVLEVIVAPWVALAALVRQKEALVQHQALQFALERSQLERSALDARLRLLQAQVEPHFLFNTLANVRMLVDVGSPKAAQVLDRLIAYLHAAVPRLQRARSTLGEELDLVRAYLDVMQLRMPDRLAVSVQADPACLTLECPPTALLTLAENAVRHGIDPGEEGGRIDIDVRMEGERCLARVADTGVGLGGASGISHGTGLMALRERLQLAFKGAADLRILANEPHGVVAELRIPRSGMSA